MNIEITADQIVPIFISVVISAITIDHIVINRLFNYLLNE